MQDPENQNQDIRQFTAEPQEIKEPIPRYIYMNPLELKRRILCFVESSRQREIPEIYHWCETQFGISESQVDRAYNSLMMEGLLYEPLPGIVRTVH